MPLIADALAMGKVSGGPPYFELFFLFPMWPLAVLMGIGLHSRWKQGKLEHLRSALKWPFWIALSMAIVVPLFVYRSGGLMTALGIGTAFWILAFAWADAEQP